MTLPASILETPLTLIAAVDTMGGIGREGKIPWKLPADLSYFRYSTLAKALIMGRTTYQSIGHPLPGRHMIVLSRDRSFTAPGCVVVHSLADALREGRAYSREHGRTEVMIGGGQELYEQTLPLAQRLMVTVVQDLFDCDRFFPVLPWLCPQHLPWKKTHAEEVPRDAKNSHYSTRLIYERSSPGSSPEVSTRGQGS